MALDTTKDEDHILALDQPGLGHLLWDSHHSFFPQDIVPRLYRLRVFAGLQVLVILASGNQVSFSGVAPGHVLDNAEVCQVIVGVWRPLASSFQNSPAACLAEWCGFFLDSGVVFATPGGGRLDLVGVFEELGTFWHVGMAVTHSTKDAGQLAEQLGGPRRDNPSNNPQWEPHRLGTIWLGSRTWLVAMLSISCWKEQDTCRMVLKKAPACSWGICSLPRSTSWVWMFRRASSVCRRATARTGGKKLGCLGKDRSEVRLLLLRDEFKNGIEGILPGLPSVC